MPVQEVRRLKIAMETRIFLRVIYNIKLISTKNNNKTKQGSRVLVIGGRSSPWLEAMALHLGAREVAVMEVLRGRRDSGLTSEHAKVDRCNLLFF